jgi:hypothetical protein
MTDLEMTKLCAEAMGIDFGPELAATNDIQARQHEAMMKERIAAYDPLHDDAQCFALVKRFHMFIEGRWLFSDEKTRPWEVEINDGEDSAWQAANSDLNRAIVECVAKMQRSQGAYSISGSDSGSLAEPPNQRKAVK